MAGWVSVEQSRLARARRATIALRGSASGARPRATSSPSKGPAKKGYGARREWGESKAGV